MKYEWREVGHGVYGIRQIRRSILPSFRVFVLLDGQGKWIMTGTYDECGKALDKIQRGGLGQWNKQQVGTYRPGVSARS